MAHRLRKCGKKKTLQIARKLFLATPCNPSRPALLSSLRRARDASRTKQILRAVAGRRKSPGSVDESETGSANELAQRCPRVPRRQFLFVDRNDLPRRRRPLESPRMHLRQPSIDRGVTSFLWAFGLGLYLWLGMLAIGVEGATAFIMSLLAACVIFLVVRLFGGDESGSRLSRRRRGPATGDRPTARPLGGAPARAPSATSSRSWAGGCAWASRARSEQWRSRRLTAFPSSGGRTFTALSLSSAPRRRAIPGGREPRACRNRLVSTRSASAADTSRAARGRRGTSAR